MSSQYETNDPNYWDLEWKKIFNHYQKDIRHAYYIAAILHQEEKRILELGAGSFRDFGALNSWGTDCYGLDYSREAVSNAKLFFPSYKNKIQQGDCFNLKYKDKFFDLSYHNGLWGYFSDDDILKLAIEQARVTKRRMVVTVHNAHNKPFVEYFEKLKLNDPLYNLRFFELQEIKNLMFKVCRNVEVIPVGKQKKFFEDDLINIGLGTPDNIKKSFDFHQLNHIDTSERLMCIGLL